MKNQFRNDGEMPAEIAAQFPVVDERKPDRREAKSKSRWNAANDRSKMRMCRDVLIAIILGSLPVILLWIFANLLLWPMVFGGAITVAVFDRFRTAQSAFVSRRLSTEWEKP